VIVQFWISLKGFSCDPFSQLPALMDDVDDPECDEYFLDRIGRAGTQIMGRITYQEMARFWTEADDHRVAPIMNKTPKVVFSKTRDPLIGRNHGPPAVTPLRRSRSSRPNPATRSSRTVPSLSNSP